jgi:tRNA-Thr(GGU) m(6)t(6)A37 methyltransferase TsaA
MSILLDPVAIVKNNRTAATDDFWGNVISEIGLLENIPTEAFENIEQFSHLEVIYYFDRVEKNEIVYSGKPRGNPEYPDMGIFAQRKKDRPNQLGLCTVELIEHSGRSIKVKYLDAIDGTPVLDIKPVFEELGSKTKIKQASWVNDLMKDYWK